MPIPQTSPSTRDRSARPSIRSTRSIRTRWRAEGAGRWRLARARGADPLGCRVVLRSRLGAAPARRCRPAREATGGTRRRRGGASATGAGGSRSAEWQLLRNALDEATRAGSKSPLAEDERLLNRLDLAAVRHVLDAGVPLLLAVNRESDLRQAIRLQQDFPVHVVVLGGAEAWRVAPELARAKIPVVLDPYADLPMSYDEIGARRDNAARLVKAGVTIAFTVSGQGIYQTYQAGPALREGAGIAVANGLPYVEALRALTANPARIWGVDARYGTLEPGRDADLVIWDGDPLEPSSAPVQVFVGGESISLRTRQTELVIATDRRRPPRAPDRRDAASSALDRRVAGVRSRPPDTARGRRSPHRVRHRRGDLAVAGPVARRPHDPVSTCSATCTQSAHPAVTPGV
jgi:imidazolonepropionase-like amidohydrolase